MNKNLTFQYFGVYHGSKDQYSPFNIVELLSRISDLDLCKRHKYINGLKNRLERIEVIPNENRRYYHLQFMKLTESFLPQLAYDNRVSTPIELNDDEYLGNDANAIYDSSYNFLMLQKNKSGMSADNITYYLSNMAIEFGLIKEDEIIFLRPFANNKEPGNKSKFKTFEFNLIGNPEGLDRESNLYRLLHYFGSFGGTTVKIKVSVGHSKTPLNNGVILQMINEIKKNHQQLNCARFSFVEDNETFTYDALCDIILNDVLKFKLESRTSLPLEKVVPRMLETYQKRLPNLLRLSRCEENNED